MFKDKGNVHCLSESFHLVILSIMSSVSNHKVEDFINSHV